MSKDVAKNGGGLTPELYVEPAPAPVPDALPAPVDLEFDARFAALAGESPVPPVQQPGEEDPVRPAAPHVIDPVLEAHFAGQVPDVAVQEPTAVPVVSESRDTSVDVGEAAAGANGSDAEMHLDSDAPPAVCESCGGEAEQGTLCAGCQQAFQTLFDNQPVSPDAAFLGPGDVPMEVDVPEAEDEPEDVGAVAVAPAAQAREIPVPPAPVVVSPDLTAAAVSPVIRIKAPVVADQPAPAAPVAVAAPAAVAPAAPAPAPKQRSAPAPAPVAVEPSQGSRLRTVAGISAVIIVIGAIGFPLSRLWLGRQESPAIVREEAPAPVVKPAPAARRVEEPATAPAPAPPVATLPVSHEVVAAPAPKAAPATPSPAPVNRLAKPVAPTASRTGGLRLPPPAPVVAAITPALPTVPPPVAEAVVAEPVAAPAPKPEAAPPAAIGPFFESHDVSETPRVATRVEPNVPDDLRQSQLNEVVIARVLVTQTGHPLMVNLLRRSKAGTSLDNAIVAAVKQWTFVPARRRGEAVSCWYHVAVQVQKAN